MKFLFDIFPVILFFAAFKGAEYFPDGALSLASSFMGDGVTATTAPVFIATVTAILATILQVGWLKLKGAKVKPMLWISLAVIVVFGGLTLWLKNEMFIKWKPTILYWIFAAVLGYGAYSGRSFIRMLMKDAVEMPDAAWMKLQWMWIVFFIVVGILNLVVAYLCSTDVWVNFKLFGLISLTLIFTIAAAVWMTKQAPGRQN